MFVVYIDFFILKITIYLARKAQIALFLAEKVTVLAEYLDFDDNFLKESAKVFLK